MGTNMIKKMVVSGVCALAVLAGSAVETHAQEAGRRPRVAILDFDYATVYSGVSAIFGQNVDVGKGITDLLVKYLVKDGSYSVIERKALDKMLAEQNFSNSDRAESNDRRPRWASCSASTRSSSGSITQFGNETKNTGIGGVGAGSGRLGIGGFGQKKTQGHRRLECAHRQYRHRRRLSRVAEGKGESKRKARHWRVAAAAGADLAPAALTSAAAIFSRRSSERP